MRPDRASLVAAVGIAALTLAIYAQVLGFAFVRYDDPRYVFENPHVMAGFTRESVAWAFTTFHESNWHPLTWLSHMLDAELFGAAPAGHHAGNVLLHLANALLWFVVLRAATGDLWPSAWVAAVFAVHPLHVESVAWVSERKDVLSTFFGLLAIAAYLAWTRRGGALRYALSLLLFAASLAAKPMLVTLPFLLLLLDAWPLGRLHSAKNLAEKVPFALLSVASSAVTIAAQRHGHATDWLHVELGARLANAGVAYATYLVHAVWPAHLAVFYPHPSSPSGVPLGAGVVASSLAALLVLTALVAWSGRRSAIVGWLWYLGALVPVSGVVQVGLQGMADRYTYVPLIGVLVAIGWSVQELVRRQRGRTTALAAAAGIVSTVALACVSWQQTGTWRDSVALYEHALAVAPSAPIHNNLGTVLDRAGRRDEALAHFREAVRIDPDYFLARRNLAYALRDQGHYVEGMQHLLRAKNVAAESGPGQLALGQARRAEGDLAGAIASFGRALELDPQSADARRDLAVTEAALATSAPRRTSPRSRAACSSPPSRASRAGTRRRGRRPSGT